MNNNEFKTKDLVLASYLLYNAIVLLGYDQLSKSWIFENTDMCNKLTLDLHNSKSNVEVLRYESIRRNLLGMAHDKSVK